MATQVISLTGPSGLATPTVRVFADGSDTQVSGSPFTLVEATNRKGHYEVSFTGTLVGLHECVLYTSNSPIGNGWVLLANASATYVVESDRNGANYFAQTGDAYARLGAPAGASIAADIALKLATSGYTAPDNATIAAIAGYVDTEVAAIKTRVELGIPTAAPGTSGGLPTCLTGAPDGARIAQVVTVAPTSLLEIAEGVRDVDNQAPGTNSLGARVNTAAATAGAVWEEPIAGHLTAGTTGAKLNSAAASGDPLSTAVPGSYASGTAGYNLGLLPAVKAKTDLIQLTGLLVPAGSTPAVVVGGAKSGGTLPSANQGATYLLYVSAQAADGTTQTPSTLRYRIDDVKSNTQVKGWTSATPGNPTAVTIAATDNIMHSDSTNQEKHEITVEATFGDGSKATGEWVFSVDRVKFLGA